jgi:TonB family protein
VIRRSPDRVRRVPDWASIPAGAVSLGLPVSGVAVRRSWPRKTSTAAAFLGAMVFLAWLVLKGPDQAESGIRAPAKARDVDVVVELPPVPPPDPQEVVEQTPTDQQILPSLVPMPAQPPSVGLVGAGEMGGKGDGTPGLDLGREGDAGDGLAVAAGGGGRGSGAGSGVGDGVGSQRFVYQVGQVDQDARPDKIVDPPYPRRAKEDGVQASVELRLLIDERGRIEQIEVLGAPPGYGFDAALKKSSLQWRFKPATLGGVPVPQWVRMPYSFHLE